MTGPIIHAFDADGTPSEGALIALEKWCRECVAERVQDIINESHLVQWYGDAPPEDGTFLRYNAAENMWDSVTLESLGLIPGGQVLSKDLLVDDPDAAGNYPVSGTSVTGPDAFGDYTIHSAGVVGPNSAGNYLASTH